MRLAVLTTCMGRLGSLQAIASPLLAELARRDAWVVCDWSCPDRAGNWLESLSDPRVHVVRRRGERWFHKTGALTLCLERAGELKASHVCQLDADTGVRPGFRAELARTLRPGSFAVAALRPGAHPHAGDSLTGLLALERAQAARVRPWDPAFRGYGAEDYAARIFCLIGGLEPRELPRELFQPLEHPDRERGAYQPDRLALSWNRNMALMRRLVRERCGKTLREIPGAARCLNRAGSSF